MGWKWRTVWLEMDWIGENSPYSTMKGKNWKKEWTISQSLERKNVLHNHRHHAKLAVQVKPEAVNLELRRFNRIHCLVFLSVLQVIHPSLGVLCSQQVLKQTKKMGRRNWEKKKSGSQRSLAWGGLSPWNFLPSLVSLSLSLHSRYSFLPFFGRNEYFFQSNSEPNDSKATGVRESLSLFQEKEEETGKNEWWRREKKGNDKRGLSPRIPFPAVFYRKTRQERDRQTTTGLIFLVQDKCFLTQFDSKNGMRDSPEWLLIMIVFFFPWIVSLHGLHFNNRCPIDDEIMGHFDYSKNKTRATVSFQAHKFPYTSSVYYQCNVRLCLKESGGCEDVVSITFLYFSFPRLYKIVL